MDRRGWFSALAHSVATPHLYRLLFLEVRQVARVRYFSERVLRALLQASWHYLGKLWKHPVFLLTLDRQCAANVEHASRPEVVSSNIVIFDDHCLFMFFHFSVCTSNKPYSCHYYICFLSPLPRQESISGPALLCDFTSLLYIS